MLTAVRIMGIDASIISLDRLFAYNRNVWLDQLFGTLTFGQDTCLVTNVRSKKIHSNKIMVKLKYWGHRQC